MGQPKPQHMGTCFSCGHVDKWMPRFNKHVISCEEPLDIDLVYRTFKVEKAADSDCMLLSTTHTPKISYGGHVSTLVCNAITVATHGEVPEGMYVCHWCDNRLCVSTKHLYIGTPSENTYDAWRNGKRVVTKEWIEAMREGRRREGKNAERALAASRANALKNRGANHWTHRSEEDMKRWQDAILLGRGITRSDVSEDEEVMPL